MGGTLKKHPPPCGVVRTAIRLLSQHFPKGMRSEYDHSISFVELSLQGAMPWDKDTTLWERVVVPSGAAIRLLSQHFPNGLRSEYEHSNSGAGRSTQGANSDEDMTLWESVVDPWFPGLWK